PRVELDPAFDKDWPALFQILPGNLCSASPKSDIYKGRFFALLSTVGGVNAINRDTEIAYRTPFRRVTHLRIARQISEQYDFVEAGHAPVIAKLFRFRQLFRCLLLLFREALVILTIDFPIKFKFRTQLRNQLRIGVKNKVHVEPRIKRSGNV